MWRRAASAVLVVTLACGGTPEAGEPVPTTGRGAATPTDALTELVGHLNAAEFNLASRLAVPGHSALASLAEDAATVDVAEALDRGDSGVAANFWSGFAQGTGTFLLGPVGYEQGESIERDGITWQVVIVRSAEGGRREVLVTDIDGYRIDLFASFGLGLADRMIEPVERLLGVDTAQSRLVLDHLTEIVPSLLVASERPGLRPESVQGLLQLVELITRVG